MLNLEWIWEPRNRTAVLLTSTGVVGAIAAVDWWTKPYVSLGFLYLFPIKKGALKQATVVRNTSERMYSVSSRNRELSMKIANALP